MALPKLLSHLKDTVVHVTASERTTWNAKANNTDSRLTTTSKELAPAINECFQYANDGKTAIATAITNEGVSASSTETFASLASKITAQLCKAQGTAVVGGCSCR